ncbi:MAG TPA: DinB family protein [Gemmatimonadales bacterium]|nr:DinB family protein [Gemmatimonadales bacterium]
MRARYDRPEASEHAADYASYIARVPDGDVVQVLQTQVEELGRLLAGHPESRGDYAYAPGKWTLKEVLGHLIDSERVFSFRALWIGRGDPAPLPGFDENRWAPNSGARNRTLSNLIEELKAVRAATVTLLRHLPPEAATRRGVANNNPVTVRALAWIMAGHVLHHERLIRERYLAP